MGSTSLFATISRKLCGQLPMAAQKHPFCNLPDEIHPILARENWLCDNLHEKEELWEELQPALRFATQMLTNDTALLWWTHLLYGRPSRTASCKCAYLEKTDKSWSPAALDDVKRYLIHGAAGKIKFNFSEHERDGELVYGVTTADFLSIFKGLEPDKNEAWLRELIREYNKGKVIGACLHPAFRSYFSSSARSLKQDLHTSFLLGITIMHELAHAVYKLHGRTVYDHASQSLLQSPNCDGIDEPFFYNPEGKPHGGWRTEAELGWSLEKYLFGLRFHADMSSQHGAQHLSQKTAFARCESTSGRDERAVSTKPESVAPFFRRRKWRHILKRNTTCRCAGNQCLPMPVLVGEFQSGYETVWKPHAALIEQSDKLYTY